METSVIKKIITDCISCEKLILTIKWDEIPDYVWTTGSIWSSFFPNRKVGNLSNVNILKTQISQNLQFTESNGNLLSLNLCIKIFQYHNFSTIRGLKGIYFLKNNNLDLIILTMSLYSLVKFFYPIILDILSKSALSLQDGGIMQPFVLYPKMMFLLGMLG